ncbi:uncharacterized protein BX664DRAFT_326049 [Halteromyces radiatus]|uniref:uncharacterized protein n=1 Tax=Halteromyces radiatus TaxID=101107 RepID=UPI0022203934|nr:uncharacterized protein BX664DRAFT_326049 [Halteromyces radiatus]KAI8097295.1 hypothetical protein BX664DRAFT_326049 [Halteromyces radiatus]
MTQQQEILQSQERRLSGSREAMEPLYEQLLQQAFPNSHSAVEFCRHACAEFGFTVKQEASANRNIYVYCSREGLPDSQRKPKPTPQRKRPSKRLLSENNQGLWEFRKSSSPTAYEHNHEMMDPKDMVKTWPAEVNSFIIQLARQRMQTHEIRDIVKQRFPDISWNERRFYNRLTEERKRIRQRDVVDRVQRILFLSSKLCSVVAGNDDWFVNVESDLGRMFEHYYHLSRLSPDALSSLVDISLDQITMDSDQHQQFLMARATRNLQQSSSSNPSSSSALLHHRSSLSSDTSSSSLVKMELEEPSGMPTKKRKSILLDPSSSPPSQQQPKGTHMVFIPSYTLYVRSHHSRSMSESSSAQQQQQQQQHRLTYAESSTSPSAMMDVTSPHPQQTLSFNNTPFYSLASPTSSSTSSVTSTFQQQQQRIPSSSSITGSSHTNQQQQQLPSSTTCNTSMTTTPSTFHTASPSDSGHQQFYMSTSYNTHSHHHHFGSGNNNGMQLQQAAQVYSMQPYNQQYTNNNNSTNVNPAEISFLDQASLMTATNSTSPPSSTTTTTTDAATNQHSTDRRQPEVYRSMMDISSQQQRGSDIRHPHDSRSTMSQSSAHPLFMYPPIHGSSNNGTTTGDASDLLPNAILQAPPTPSTTYHQARQSTVQQQENRHQDHQQQQKHERSNVVNEMVIDGSSL